MKKYTCIVGEHETTEPQAAKIEDAACCVPCAVAHNHPGKFEKYTARDHDDFMEYYAEDMGKALILYNWDLDGNADMFMSNEGWGYCAMMDNYLLTQDDRGFVEFEEFKTAVEAERRFDELYTQGWGASEDDIYVQHDYRSGWEAYESGKKIECWPDQNGEITRERVLAAVSLHMRKTGCFPDIWEIGERGDVTNIGSEVW